jgi:capsule polysaccharide export protein KpsE/RkpR
MNAKEHSVRSAELIVAAQEARLHDSMNALTNGKARIVAERARIESEHAQQISGMERDVAVARTQLEMDRAYLDKAKTDAEIGYEQI